MGWVNGRGSAVFPLLSLALLKNGIHAIFELWVLLCKTQGIVDAGILPARLYHLALAKRRFFPPNPPLFFSPC
jgi:hypothetical protein